MNSDDASVVLWTSEGRDCSKCGVWKPWSEFYNSKKHSSGYRPDCKDCCRERYKSRNYGVIKRREAVEPKICSSCKTPKKLSEFHKNNGAPDGYQNECKTCRSDRHRGSYSGREYDLQRRYHLNTMFKMTFEDYEKILEQQNGVCAVCGTSEIGRTLVVDHDRHCCSGPRSCGNCVRALLCMSCNVGIGNFKESPEVMRKAAKYVEDHREVVTESR